MVVLCKLLTGKIFTKGDIGDEQLVIKIFEDHRIDTVLHFAAQSNVGKYFNVF